MDWGVTIGLISLALTIPLGVASIFVYRWLERTLEQRKLIKSHESRQQAIREYDLIKELHNGTRDKYAHYLQLTGWSIIFGIISSTMALIFCFNSPDLEWLERRSPLPPIAILLLLAILFFVLSLSLMFVLYDRSRKVHRFNEYKADFIRKWGSID